MSVSVSPEQCAVEFSEMIIEDPEQWWRGLTHSQILEYLKEHLTVSGDIDHADLVAFFNHLAKCLMAHHAKELRQ
jgi:hypothetical protein